MRRPPALTHLAAATALAVLAAGLATAAPGTASAADGASGARATTSTVTYKPAQTSAYVANSLRGEYRWSGQAAPDGRPTPDLYYRDQVPWNQIEPTQGTFDDSSLDDGIAQARAAGGRFGFRVLSWCPGCWSNEYKPYSKNDWVPDWMPRQAGTNIPDWNSEGFLSAWEALWAHLGARYAHDPAVGWIDVGGYGSYGEWHVTAGASITVPNAERLTRAVLDAFPDTHVVVNAMDPTLTNALLKTFPRLGLRTDCLGEYQMFSLIPSSAPGSLIAERWRTAPVLSEWCHSGGTSQTRGASQVAKYHVSQVSSGNVYPAYADMSATQQAGFRKASLVAGYRYAATSVTVPRAVTRGAPYDLGLTLANSGSAPTYDDWEVVLQTRTSTGEQVSEQVLPIPLTKLLAGSRAYTKAVTAPAAAGTYRLRLLVRDPDGYLAPMALANTTRSTTGSYALGSLVVK